MITRAGQHKLSKGLAGKLCPRGASCPPCVPRGLLRGPLQCWLCETPPPPHLLQGDTRPDPPPPPLAILPLDRQGGARGPTRSPLPAPSLPPYAGLTGEPPRKPKPEPSPGGGLLPEGGPTTRGPSGAGSITGEPAGRSPDPRAAWGWLRSCRGSFYSSSSSSSGRCACRPTGQVRKKPLPCFSWELGSSFLSPDCFLF